MAMKVIRLFLLMALLLAFVSAQRTSPPIMPNPAKTPGDTLAVTKNDICVPGYSKKVRDVPESGSLPHLSWFTIPAL